VSGSTTHPPVGAPSGPSELDAARRREIRRLPDALIDQIAAGEVVERPASVVKELVENALDAGATRIRVEVRGGGQDFIAVTDDGCGMSVAGARLAVERHATSKISSQTDLETIRTFGFRGEALPAIASVSRFRLRSRARDADVAHQIEIDGGKLLSEKSVGAPVGTRVEVADLFASVPARRKFLKTVTTEWGHISDWLTRSALALPHVHFEIQRDERNRRVWPAVTDPLDRVAAVVSEEDAAAFVPVPEHAHREASPRLSGFVSRPDRHRATVAGIYLFVNRRPVRDRMLQHALIEAYRDVLPRARFPAAVLFLDVPPHAVDVNVHPAKWEVRFADPQSIHRLIRHSVREALAQRSWIGGAPAAGGTVEPTPPDRTGEPPGDWVLAGTTHRAGPGQTGQGTLLETQPQSPLPSQLETRQTAEVRLSELPLFGQLLATYLIVEAREGLVLIDQHAAHERVLYERLRSQWLEAGVERQGLLVPETLQIEARAVAALEEASEAVWKLGFDIEPFGDDTVAIRAVPALLADRDPAGLVRGLADELCERGHGGDAAAPEARLLEAADRCFATLACHSARRKGETLAPAEQRALLEALDSIPWAPTCPHGRPVAVPIEIAEIERRFARR